jgi:hypothetical protein
MFSKRESKGYLINITFTELRLFNINPPSYLYYQQNRRISDAMKFPSHSYYSRKLLPILLFLLGVSGILYLAFILPLYSFTGAKHFEMPSRENLNFYYTWTRIITELGDVWLLCFLIWLPVVITLFITKKIGRYRKWIWFGVISFILTILVDFVSVIGGGWWKEYSFMIHDLYQNA